MTKKEIAQWLEEWDYRMRSAEIDRWDQARREWQRRQEERCAKAGGAFVFSMHPDDFEDTDRPKPLLVVRHRLCLSPRGGRGNCLEDHRPVGRWPCHDPFHDLCLNRSLLKLLIGVRESGNPGHPGLMDYIGPQASLWRTKREMAVDLVASLGGAALEAARGQLNDALMRWNRKCRLFHRTDLVEFNAKKATLMVWRYLLADANADPGRCKATEFIRAGATEDLVLDYVRTVKGSWTEGKADEGVARVLAHTLTGAHRTASFRGFSRLLDAVELKRLCPVCGELIEFCGWVDGPLITTQWIQAAGRDYRRWDTADG